jgi:hypothetical protein
LEIVGGLNRKFMFGTEKDGSLAHALIASQRKASSNRNNVQADTEDSKVFK